MDLPAGERPRSGGWVPAKVAKFKSWRVDSKCTAKNQGPAGARQTWMKRGKGSEQHDQLARLKSDPLMASATAFLLGFLGPVRRAKQRRERGGVRRTMAPVVLLSAGVGWQGNPRATASARGAAATSAALSSGVARVSAHPSAKPSAPSGSGACFRPDAVA